MQNKQTNIQTKNHTTQNQNTTPNFEAVVEYGLAYWLRRLHPTLEWVPGFDIWFQFPTGRLWEAAVMDEIIRSLPPMWEAHFQFPAPGLGPGHCRHLQRQPVDGILHLPISVSPINKWINK